MQTTTTEPATVETEAPVTPAAPAPAEKPTQHTDGAATAPTEETTAPPPEAVPERVVPEPGEYKVPEGIPAEISEFAHANGFTQEQLDATLKQFGGYVSAADAAKRTGLREKGEQFIESWGEMKQTNLQLAKGGIRYLDQEMGGKLIPYLNESGGGNDPVLLEAAYILGKSMQEGGFLKRAIRRPKNQKTAAEALYGQNHPVTR